MAIHFYAGILNEDNTVDTFIPANIVKPIANEPSWNSGLAYAYKDYPGEFSKLATNVEIKNVDENPILLNDIVKTLFNVTSATEWNTLFRQNKVISFFTEENVESKLGFDLTLFESDTTDKYYLGYLGNFSKKIGMIFRFYYNSQIILALGESYNQFENFDDMLEEAKQIEEYNFLALNHTNYMNYPQHMLFMAMTYYYGVYTLPTFDRWFVPLLYYSQNLSRFGNWYTMITNKYIGKNYKLKLKVPIKGLNYIDLTSPTISNIDVDNGFENNNLNKTYAYDYINVGTDLFYLFEPNYSSDDVQTIPLENGFIRKEYVSPPSDLPSQLAKIVKFSILVDGKGINIICNPYQDLMYKVYTYPDMGNYRYRIGIGFYLTINGNYFDTPLNQWITNISSDYDKWEFNNSPFNFTAYSYNYNNTLSTLYFNYTSFPNAILPKYIGNFSYSNLYISYNYKESTIDYAFWENLLPNVVLSTDDGGGGGKPNIGEDSKGGGTSTTGGGKGLFDDKTDNITNTGDIYSVVGNLGNLITIYQCTDSEINDLGQWLNSESALSALTTDTRIQSIISLSKLRTPNGLNPSVKSSRQNIALGGVISDISANVVVDRYVDYDFGDMEIKEYFGSFLDYSPYTKINIYLPFVGSIELPTDEFMNKKLTLKCTTDILTGTITYMLGIKEENITSYRYTYSGTCIENLPVTNADYSGKLNSLISGIIESSIGIGTIASGSLLGGVSTTATGAYNVINSVSNLHIPNTNRTGQINSTAGLHSILFPYLSITRPKMSLPDNYATQYGYPSNIYANLGSLNGYTQIENIHLENIPCTSSEIEEIDNLLKDGIIF